MTLTFTSRTAAVLWYWLIYDTKSFNLAHFSTLPNISLSCELVQQAAAGWLQLTATPSHLVSSRSPI